MSENIDALTTIRPMDESDTNFIFATWLRGLYYGNTWFNEIPKDIFMENYHKVIEHLLAKDAVEVRIACLKDDSSTILGYAVLEPDRKAIHWIHVKDAWRKLGLMNRLLGKDKWVTTTHLTDLMKSIKPLEVKFNPFL